MAMSRKNYQEFATMLHDVYRKQGTDPTFDLVLEGTIGIFERDNPRFDQGRFRRVVAEGGR